jgi:ribosome-associated protein
VAAGRETSERVSTIARTKTKRIPQAAPRPALLPLTLGILEDGKAEDVVVIELGGKSSIADHMIIATGRSARQVVALAERLAAALREAGHGRPAVEGLRLGDWVLIDAGDLIVHVFRPEVRGYYNLEKMWGADLAEAGAVAQ